MDKNLCNSSPQRRKGREEKTLKKMRKNIIEDYLL